MVRHPSAAVLCILCRVLLCQRVTCAYSPDVSCSGVAPSLAFTAAAFESERRRGIGNGLLTRAADVVFVPLGVLALRLTQEGFNLICFLVVSSLLAQVYVCVCARRLYVFVRVCTCIF